MNNNIPDSDIREEELFKKFLEKNTNEKSLFNNYSNDEDVSYFDNYATRKEAEEELSELEELEALEEMTQSYEDSSDDELTFSDLVPQKIDDINNFTGKGGKLKYWFRFHTHKENAKKISCIAIPGFLCLMFVINFLVPSKNISVKENRALAQFPRLTLSTIADGSFAKGFEEYISDQFVFRNIFVSMKRRTETMIGKKENHGILLAKDGYLIENSADLTHENIESNLNAINELAKTGRYNLTLAVVPTAYEVMSEKLPANSYTGVYNDLYGKIKNNITQPNIKVTDANPVLKKNKDKELYYRSDHHQTAHGSYYLYTALAPSLGFDAIGVDKFKIEEKADNFKGTTWSNSGFAPTKADKIYKYTYEEKYSCSVEFPMEDKKMKSLYSDDMLKTKDKYSYYLDGNHGIAEIKSSCPSGKRLAIIKDSYAHSLVPFLANHYSRIYMIDLRYFNGDIFEYLYGTDVKDVLVLYNQNTFMTDTNLEKITTFAKSSDYNRTITVKPGVVPESEEVDISYFDDAVFVGDSVTLGISYFSEMNAEFLCMSGMSTMSLDKEKLSNGKTVLETIKNAEHIGKIYIMLGANEVIYENPSEYADRYSEFIDTVRTRFPNVVVYIESITPVSRSYSDSHQLKNHLITEYNEQLKKIAVEKDCYYLDLNSYFAGEDGYLPEGAAGDGIHFTPDNYRKLAGYLRTHVVNNIEVKKKSENASAFTGGDFNTLNIAKNLVSAIQFKDKLSVINDSLVISNYGIDNSFIRSAALYMSGGSTAEEVAVFEVDSVENTEKLIGLIKQRIENKKKDFENYKPAEMAKLNNPTIVVKDKVVVVCIADSADKDVIVKNIK